LELLRPSLRAVVILGAFGWQAALPAFGEAGWLVPRPKPAFAHGIRVTLRREDAASSAAAHTAALPGPASPGPVELFGCFHVSQHNTVTGRLTPAMLRDVLSAAAEAVGLRTGEPHAPCPIRGEASRA
jgi:uracil-DNA glycosylase